MPLEQAQSVLSYFKRLGSQELVLVGGEPTLHPALPEIIDCAKNLGYKRITIDTNGLESHYLTSCVGSKIINRVRVSLDGAIAATHDRIRGHGSFDKAIDGINNYIKNGFNVEITTTVTQFNLNELAELISLCDALNIRSLNLHSLSVEGFGSDKHEWVIDPETWVRTMENICRLAKTCKVKIVYPPLWAKLPQLKTLAQYGYNGCIGTKLDRISVFSDGRVQVCTPMLGHSEPFGWFAENSFITSKKANEFEEFLNSKAMAVSSLQSGCPAHKYENITSSDGWIPVCRLWRIEASNQNMDTK